MLRFMTSLVRSVVQLFRKVKVISYKETLLKQITFEIEGNLGVSVFKFPSAMSIRNHMIYAYATKLNPFAAG